MEDVASPDLPVERYARRCVVHGAPVDDETLFCAACGARAGAWEVYDYEAERSVAFVVADAALVEELEADRRSLRVAGRDGDGMVRGARLPAGHRVVVHQLGPRRRK